MYYILVETCRKNKFLGDPRGWSFSKSSNLWNRRKTSFFYKYAVL